MDLPDPSKTQSTAGTVDCTCIIVISCELSAQPLRACLKFGPSTSIRYCVLVLGWGMSENCCASFSAAALLLIYVALGLPWCPHLTSSNCVAVSLDFQGGAIEDLEPVAETVVLRKIKYLRIIIPP